MLMSYSLRTATAESWIAVRERVALYEEELSCSVGLIPRRLSSVSTRYV